MTSTCAECSRNAAARTRSAKAAGVSGGDEAVLDGVAGAGERLVGAATVVVPAPDGAAPVPLNVVAQPATARASSSGAVRTRRTVRARDQRRKGRHYHIGKSANRTIPNKLLCFADSGV